MGVKLGKSELPAGHNREDFKCFGPPATQDASFDGTMICDMGCFTQDGKDTNKYYHAAIVQSKKTAAFFTYFEWGRTGACNPQFQFIQCASQSDAQDEYSSQLHSKNDKRGVWITIAGKRALQAKPGKDCYLVRPQATRSTGLPDARTISANEGVKPTAAVAVTKKSGKPVDVDYQTLSLMRDLNVATVSYARTSMADSAIPTQTAIEEARDILQEAKKRLVVVGDDTEAQVADKTIVALTNHIYSRIPKIKARNAAASTWILSANNIGGWECDLDAFESALVASNKAIVTDEDPLGGMPISMSWLDPKSEIGKFIYSWTPSATRNVHGNVGHMNIKNVWVVDRNGEADILARAQANVAKDRPSPTERPLHQPRTARPDVKDAAAYLRSHTCMMLHGTRSVNVSGILRTSFRLPKELVGVKLNASMFGGGIYWADDVGKSAQYTSLGRAIYTRDNSGTVRGRDAFLFIGDVIIGNPYVAPHGEGFTKPPAGHHSVFGKMNHTKFYADRWDDRKLQNNEFIVYAATQCRIRYLVEFQA